MKNLIQNPCLAAGPDGRPECFTLSGPGLTHDHLCLNGSRTISVSRPRDASAKTVIRYDPIITVRGRKALRWGFCMRAVEAEHVTLVANFRNARGPLIEKRFELGGCVPCDFHRKCARFEIPHRADTVRLSIELDGTVTALTLHTPEACFC